MKLNWIEEEELREKVFTAIGEASMCWNPKPSGVFDSSHAKEISEQLIDYIKNNLKE